jgi:hypothetical protein
MSYLPSYLSDPMNYLLIEMYKPALTEKNKATHRDRLSDLRVVQKNLLPYIFRFDEFQERCRTMPKLRGEGTYKPSSVKQYLQAVCLLFRHGSAPQIVELFNGTFVPKDNDLNEHTISAFMKNDEIPVEFRYGQIQKYIAPFHFQNAENCKNSKNCTAKVELPDKERVAWVHMLELRDAFKEALPRIMMWLDDRVEDDRIKEIYFWCHTALHVFCTRVTRADMVDVLNPTEDPNEQPADKSYYRDGQIHIRASRKNKNNYTIVLPDGIRELIDKLVLFSKSKGSQYLFAKCGNKQDGPFEGSSFGQSYISNVAKAMFGKNLTRNLMRKISATYHYQVWLARGGGTQPHELVPLAANMDHSLENHFKSYVHDDMFDLNFKLERAGQDPELFSHD